MKFSIIIPAHNAAQFIGNAIESILNQSFSDYELIVVCDRCEDETEAKVSKYQKLHKQLIVCQNTVVYGVSAARNTGLKRASGEYVLFLDADDTYISSALEELNQLILKNDKPDVLFSGYNRVTENQLLIKPFSYSFPQSAGAQLAGDYLNKISYTHLGALCFNYIFLSKNNLQFDCRFNFAEDIVFVSKALFFAKTVSSTNITIHNWTLRKGSTIYTNTIERFQSLTAIASLKEFQEKQKIQSTYLNKAIANHYAMLLLDTVNTLLWLGCDEMALNQEIKKRVDFSLLFPYIHLQSRLRKGVLCLRYRRNSYLQRIRGKSTPNNFIIASKNSFSTEANEISPNTERTEK